MDAQSCLPALSRQCTPSYEPSFDALFANRLQSTCGGAATGRSCHGPDGAMGGLILATPEAAYDALLGHRDSHARVVPGDPECSVLMQRLVASDPAVQMPPGADQRLSDAEICSVLMWIDQGALR